MAQAVDITKWSIMSLAEHWNKGVPLTPAEKLAKAFLEEMGKYCSAVGNSQFGNAKFVKGAK